MKEITYEEWQKNPTPREMWVWDSDKNRKVKRKVLYIFNEGAYPVLALNMYDNRCDSYRRCAEIADEIEESKTRRMTNQEFSWWLRENPTREWAFIFQKPTRAHTVFEYFDNEANQPVDDDIVVRENGGEWHEPLVEVEE